jgi:hypothetical protein
MGNDLKVADAELLLIGNELLSRCGELEDILVQYQSVMNKVSAEGLDSASITPRIQGLTHRLEPVKGMLEKHKVSLKNNTDGFVSRIGSIDRF